MQKITPFVWFDDKAEDAAKLYTSLFKDSAITDTRRLTGAGPGWEGAVMSVTFKLAGQDYIALNGGPQFSFSPAISLFITCETQAEVDELWDKLSEGGKKNRCGWLTDRFGVSWQVVPRGLGEMLGGPDAARSKRVFEAMMQMTKLEIAVLRSAHDAA